MTSMPAPIHRRMWDLKRRIANALMWAGAIIATVAAVTPLCLVLFYVAVRGASVLSIEFFTQMPKPLGEPGGGMAHAIVGTLIVVGLASAVGLPIGVLGGIHLAEFGNTRLGASVRFAADVLSGVPSIVVGIFAYALIVVPMGRFSALAGGAALGVIMIPTVMRTTEELVRLVPASQREAALALGATHARTTFRVVMLSARGGVVTGVLLAIARVAGETAPLLFTALGNLWWSTRIDQPMASLPVQIYNYARQPFEQWHAHAWAGSLVLVSLIFVLSVAARVATRGRFRTVR